MQDFWTRLRKLTASLSLLQIGSIPKKERIVSLSHQFSGGLCQLVSSSVNARANYFITISWSWNCSSFLRAFWGGLGWSKKPPFGDDLRSGYYNDLPTVIEMIVMMIQWWWISCIKKEKNDRGSSSVHLWGGIQHIISHSFGFKKKSFPVPYLTFQWPTNHY